MIKGMICLWFGAILAIPDGWQLCNGSNGTPDLRDKFIVGAGNTYNPDDNSAVSTHTHDDTYLANYHNLTAQYWIYSGALFNYLTSIDSETMTTDSDSCQPPYKALCYIQKS